MEELLQKVKQNLILSHAADDELLKAYITAAVSYAESYQHLEKGYYQANPHAAHHRTSCHHAVVPFL